MSTTPMPWFRMYADFLNDPKMVALAFEDQRHFIGVLALKCAGALDGVANADLLDRIVAQRLWIDHGVIRDVKRRLVSAGLINESWQPLAWDKRQFVSDRDGTALERKRRQRAREREERDAENVTDTSRVTVTAESRVTQRDGHAGVTRLDTDTEADTDTEENQDRGSSGGAPQKSSSESDADLPSASRPGRTARATRLPSDWALPRRWGEWALQENPGWTPERVRRVAEQFRDHWVAKGGADARKTDWEATWRNWIRREGDMQRPFAGTPAAGASTPNRQEALEQRNREVASRLANGAG